MSTPRFWDPAVRFERAARRAVVYIRDEQRAYDCAGSWALVRAIVQQTIDDLRLAHGGVLEDALLYLLEDHGEFINWHAVALDLDPQAVRERARQLVLERFGEVRGAALWSRCARFALGRKRRRAA